MVESYVNNLGTGELGDIVELLAELLRRGVGAQSTWALAAAAGVIGLNGVGGELVIKIPSNPKDYAEVMFFTGSVRQILGGDR